MIMRPRKLCIPRLILGLLWIQCLVLLSTSSKVQASSSVGSKTPTRLKPKRYAFTWQASVDASNGIALSKETMQASPKSAIAQHFQNGGGSDYNCGGDVWTDIIDRLEKYPEWVARGAVTFGLFRAVPIELEGGGTSYYSLQDRIFGIDLLIFGIPHSQRFSFLKPTTTPQTATITHDDDATTTNGVQQFLQPRVEVCTVTIPIVGGLLALCKGGGNSNNRGCLKFTLKHNEALSETQLVTEIRGYSPLLLGLKEPVPFYRKLLYLSTQSIVHAYVMWRFQRHCIHTSYHDNTVHDKSLAAVEGFASYVGQ